MSCEQVVASLLDSLGDVSAEVLRRLWGKPGFDERHMHPADLASAVPANLRRIIRCLDGSPAPAAEAADSARLVGEVCALQEVPIHSFAQSWAVAERVILDHLLGHAAPLSAEELRETVRRLGEVIGELTQVSVEAYRRTQDEVTAHYDRLTADLIARLTADAPVDPELVRRRALAAGVDPGAPYLAVAVGLPPGEGPGAFVRAQRHLLAALTPACPSRILVGSVDEQPLLLVPAQPGQFDRLRTALEECVVERLGPEQLVLGCGDYPVPLVEAGPACREAQLAVQVGLRLGWTDRLVRFGAVAPEALLVRSPDIAELVSQRLTALWQRPELVDTLRVYLREGMSARAAARELFVHPNTIQYRLRIIRRILDRPLSDALGLADVILALRGSALR